MRIPSWMLSVITLLALAGCSSYSVVTDYDSSVGFGSYKTYHWSADTATKSSDDVLAKNPLVFKRVKAAVDKELLGKGFVLKETGPVDFSVSLYAGIHDRVIIGPPSVVLSYSYHHGYYRERFGGYYPYWWDPYGPYPRASYYEEGTLVIDIIDEKSDELAWRGMGSGILKNYDTAKEMHQDIDDAVARILEKFPPLRKER